jgi:hypothetical protein
VVVLILFLWRRKWIDPVFRSSSSLQIQVVRVLAVSLCVEKGLDLRETFLNVFNDHIT